MVITRSGLDTAVQVKTSHKTTVIYHDDNKTPILAHELASLVADNIITASPSLFKQAIKTYGRHSRTVKSVRIDDDILPHGLPSYGFVLDMWHASIPVSTSTSTSTDTLPIELSIDVYIDPHPTRDDYGNLVVYSSINIDDIFGEDIDRMEVTMDHWNTLERFRKTIQDRIDTIRSVKDTNECINTIYRASERECQQIV